MSNNSKVWQRTVERAIVSCIDYDQPTPTISRCLPEKLKNGIVQYIQEKNQCSEEEAKSYYEVAERAALTKLNPGGKYLLLAKIGFVVMLILAVVHLVIFAVSNYTWLFFICAVGAVFLAKTCYDYIRAVKKNGAADALMSKWIETATQDDMLEVFAEMEKILG